MVAARHQRLASIEPASRPAQGPELDFFLDSTVPDRLDARGLVASEDRARATVMVTRRSMTD
jgi:hypothetical protein